MKTFQQIVIGILVLLPLILGVILSTSGNLKNSHSPLRSSGIKKVGLVKVEGAIYSSYETIRQLRSFLNDNSIAGVLLRVDSPGGATAPSQEIYNTVLQFKKKNKPLIVSMGSMAASGGYYISSPAQKIFADPGTMTGSIGVIISTPQYNELGKKIGVEMRVMKAGKFKDILSPYRKVTNAENDLIQNFLDDTHEQFISDVAIARDLPYDSIKAIADGRIFTGRQAVISRLVDTLGGFEDALHYLKYKTGLSQKSKTVERKERFDLFSEWITEELVHFFPQLLPFIRPSGAMYMFSFEG
ncbi:MAG: signal peptide peptidase SppA [Chitinispirillaceae bacterium]|nr:signal peptide peptidase SppA [Chitinispirillaceae bacterium]